MARRSTPTGRAVSCCCRRFARLWRQFGPPEEPDSSNYSFRAMAQDQVEVMQALGYDRFYTAGHDRGGRTVHRMCLDHPDKVLKAAVIDIIPTLDQWAAMNM